jgi:CrcB protein
MPLALAVALGGAAGSLARHLVNQAVPAVAGVPLATLLVNVVGSFVLGVVLAVLPAEPPSALRFALGAGFCGGFTTFSAFSVELLALGTAGAAPRAAAYALASVVLGVAAALAGTLLGRALALTAAAR